MADPQNSVVGRIALYISIQCAFCGAKAPGAQRDRIVAPRADLRGVAERGRALADYNAGLSIVEFDGGRGP